MIIEIEINPIRPDKLTGKWLDNLLNEMIQPLIKRGIDIHEIEITKKWW